MSFGNEHNFNENPEMFEALQVSGCAPAFMTRVTCMNELTLGVRLAYPCCSTTRKRNSFMAIR